MKRKLVFTILPIFLLACYIFLPDPPPEQETTPIAPSVQQEPEQIESLTLTGFTIVRLHPGDGNLQTMLADEAQKAMSQGLMPVVEFDATWCPPCRAIDTAIKAENDLMLKAYQGTYIIKLDVDEWGWKNGKVKNFRFDGIPVYFKLDEKGKQTGEVIDGGAWNEDIPENIAPVMDKFFHGN